MRCKVGPRHELRKLFSGLVEHVFLSELGICNTRLTDYLSELLSEFVHTDDVYRVRDVDGRAIREVSHMRADAQLGPHVTEHERKRTLNRYIGDFTLFWTGVYPEQLRARHSGGVDRLTEYLLEGKRSYAVASDLTRGREEPAGDLLQALSENFESCVLGLHLVRGGWEATAASGRYPN